MDDNIIIANQKKENKIIRFFVSLIMFIINIIFDIITWGIGFICAFRTV